MQGPEEKSEDRQPLSQFYQLLNLNISADDSQVRAAYIYLSRIWHPIAEAKWKGLGLEVNDSLCRRIYRSVQNAFNVVENADSRNNWLVSPKKNSSILILDENTKEYKARFEQTCKVHLQPVSLEEQKYGLGILPTEILVSILSLLSLRDLANAGVVTWLFRNLTNQARWKIINRTGNEKLFFRFCHNFGPRFTPSTLTEVFVAPPTVVIEDPNQDIVSAAITTAKLEITAFQKLIETPFDSYIHQRLDDMVQRGSKLPEPYKKRSDFLFTHEYFTWLMRNVHDLYLTLHRNPDLINHQDENGQTLLFYPVIAAQNLSKDRVQWIVHILTSVPSADLKIVDKANNSFLHVTTANCTAEFTDKTGIASTSDHLIFNHVFLPLLQLAVENNFDFNQLNRERMTVLHVAANLPINKLNPVFSLNYHREKTNLDPKLLSGEDATALYYAVSRGSCDAINILIRVTDPLHGSADKQPLTALSHKIQDLCRDTKKLLGLISTKNCLDYSQEYEPFHSQLWHKLALIIHFRKLFSKMVIKIKGRSVLESDLSWPTETMIQDILKLYSKTSSAWGNFFSMTGQAKENTNNLLKELSLPVNLSTLENLIWLFLGNKANNNSPLFKAILEVFNQQLDCVAKYVNADEVDCKYHFQTLNVALVPPPRP